MTTDYYFAIPEECMQAPGVRPLDFHLKFTKIQCDLFKITAKSLRKHKSRPWQGPWPFLGGGNPLIKLISGAAVVPVRRTQAPLTSKRHCRGAWRLYRIGGSGDNGKRGRAGRAYPSRNSANYELFSKKPLSQIFADPWKRKFCLSIEHDQRYLLGLTLNSPKYFEW